MLILGTENLLCLIKLLSRRYCTEKDARIHDWFDHSRQPLSFGSLFEELVQCFVMFSGKNDRVRLCNDVENLCNIYK